MHTRRTREQQIADVAGKVREFSADLSSLQRSVRQEALEEAAKLVENFCYAFEGNEVCKAVNENLRKAAAEIRHRAKQEM